MWILLKQLWLGMDLFCVVLFMFVLELCFFLNKFFDYYYYVDLFFRVVVEEDVYSCMKLVLWWYLFGFYKKFKGIKKLYNFILGEIFCCCWFYFQIDSCIFYIVEQVFYYFFVFVFYVSNWKDGFCISGSIIVKFRFYGNLLLVLLDGKVMFIFLN